MKQIVYSLIMILLISGAEATLAGMILNQKLDVVTKKIDIETKQIHFQGECDGDGLARVWITHNCPYFEVSEEVIINCDNTLHHIFFNTSIDLPNNIKKGEYKYNILGRISPIGQMFALGIYIPLTFNVTSYGQYKKI